MGQGTDSCGGYEVEYDPYEEGLSAGEWVTRTGATVKISKMTLQHLKGAKRIAQNAVRMATFSDTREMWESWVELLDDEIDIREAQLKRAAPPTVGERTLRPAIPVKKPVRGTMTVMICHCGAEYQARAVDLKRGNGYSCSKRCAAIRREFGRPAAKPKR